MKSPVCVLIMVALGGLAAPAIAQVAQTYQYDSNGRLKAVTTTGSAGTNTAAYTYDDADNRTSRSQTGTAYAAIYELPADVPLHDGRYSFALGPVRQPELHLGETPPRSLAESALEAPLTIGVDGEARFQPNGLTNRRLAHTILPLSENGDLVPRNRVGGTAVWRSSAPMSLELTK